MKTKCILVLSVGMLVTMGAYAFFADWTKMPQQMMQMTQPQPQPLVCDCRCN